MKRYIKKLEDRIDQLEKQIAHNKINMSWSQSPVYDERWDLYIGNNKDNYLAIIIHSQVLPHSKDGCYQLSLHCGKAGLNCEKSHHKTLNEAKLYAENKFHG